MLLKLFCDVDNYTNFPYLVFFSSKFSYRFSSSFPFPLTILRCNVHFTWKNYQDSERLGYLEMAESEQAKAEQKKIANI